MFILVSHAQRIIRCGEGGGQKKKGNVSSLVNFFEALGNCKIIDILQWWRGSLLLHNTFIIIHSPDLVISVLIC